MKAPPRIAIVDSGIFIGHPLSGPIAGGIVLAGEDLTDHLGHGTAVAAVIHGLAPSASLFIVKIFDRSLVCPPAKLSLALQWCLENQMDIVNLSLGVSDGDASVVTQVRLLLDAGVEILAPAGSCPGNIPGVIGVEGVARAGSLEGESFAVAQATGHRANSRF